MSDRKTALIIDDEEQLLRLMVRVLERAGYQAWGAEDADAGLRLFHEHLEEIDLVLPDVIMPGPGADGSRTAKPSASSVNGSA